MTEDRKKPEDAKEQPPPGSKLPGTCPPGSEFHWKSWGSQGYGPRVHHLL